MSAGCLVCRETAGEIELPGGLLLDEASHRFPWPSGDRGHARRVPRLAVGRHAARFEDLSAGEAASMGIAISRLAQVLRVVAGADHVFVVRIGTGAAHLHVHLLPRYPETPRDLPWHQIDEWEGARRGGFAEAAELVAALRERL